MIRNTSLFSMEAIHFVTPCHECLLRLPLQRHRSVAPDLSVKLPLLGKRHRRVLLALQLRNFISESLGESLGKLSQLFREGTVELLPGLVYYLLQRLAELVPTFLRQGADCIATPGGSLGALPVSRGCL
eukprot:CAMPEP_0204259534 /NCGR_PEP_ID=MMETSP0468-20130131/5707_1 /ASSEMBLY_ACC=CAM_ASM_000383 /TAXON_ID=2969 /ORGANISM="Oxyrrhis marina" /LENGTH=128 /DNA_ID=CAMNT_0051233839 /DNA_START=266 /DNA_END=648 /DNA_ORIENTATION=-